MPSAMFKGFCSCGIVSRFLSGDSPSAHLSSDISQFLGHEIVYYIERNSWESTCSWHSHSNLGFYPSLS